MFTETSPGKGKLRFNVGGDINKCSEGDLDATLTKTADNTVIAIEPRAGCTAVRFVVKNDGSGGHREIRKGDDWVPDGLDRGLTLKK